IKYRKKAGKLASVSLSMIIGGAIGNLIDRALQGFVTDFIEFDFVRFAIFNVADCFVVIGVILLMIYILFIHDKREAKEVK
ncbi:MAG: signal peptidase II, partial [Christensenellaceae bacterium]